MKFYDEIKESESKFAFKELLGLEFFKDYKDRYKWQKDQGVINPYRSYLALLGNIDEINIYNKQHANKFVKDFKTAGKDSNNAESIFSEIIVYRYYIRMVYEGLIKSITIVNNECDLILERIDGSKVYYELFCVTPEREEPDSGNKIVRDIKSHTQKAMSSIRQKLLNKMRKQKQMSKDRENYAVI